jgi:pimeloyl-ACP methyl ester carboxylesterase
MLAPLVAREVDVERIAVFGTSQRRFTETHVAAGRRLWQRRGLDASEIEANTARLEGRLRDLRAGSDRRIEGRVAAFFRQLDEADLAGAWSAVRCPVLSMHGETDWITIESEAREISPERTLEIPHAGHDLTDARTGELSLAIVEALVAFYGGPRRKEVRS